MSTSSAMELKITTWDIFSDIIGWSYFLVWSVSFYPQVYLNWKRKSVRGLSIDFLFYNLLGFFCYSIFNLCLYYNKEIREEYHQRHPHSEHSLVRFNDVVFSIHGFFLSLFILFQSCIYKKHETQQISSFAASFIWLAVMGSVLVISTIHYGGAVWLDFMYYLSSITSIVSFIKYLPQVWINYKRQSTQGWSIHYIIWDLSGGVLSIIQLLLDAYIEDDWTGIEGDNVKLGLGLIVVGYDVIFLLQHYLWYPNRQASVVPFSHEERKRFFRERNRFPNEYDSSSGSSSPSTVSTNIGYGGRRPINAYKATHYGSTGNTPYSSSV